jgi:phosphonate transport system substrate-binding protein
MKRCLTLLIALAMFACCANLAFAADGCKHRGDLDQMYCDENGTLTADLPKDPAKWKDPGILVFTYTPVEDPAVYKDAFSDFMKFLETKTGKKLIYYSVHSNSAEVEAMRSGRLHIAGFSTGPTIFAVNLAGYVPIAVKGYEKEFQGYRLIVIVKANSPLNSLADLKGKKVAHTAPSSNSGHLAPLALFPREGITPGKDYQIVFSGKHDQSVLGVNYGDYDAACVASDVFKRMADAGRVKGEEYKIIWQSSIFPTSSFGLAHDLHPDLAKKIKDAFFEYRFTPEMQKTFGGADRFFPVTYKEDWATIALIAKAAGDTFDAAGLEKMRAQEEAQAKKAREAGTPAKQ